MEDVIKLMKALKIVPVLVVERVEDALPLGQALLDAGLPIAEVTLRTNVALEIIHEMSKIDELTVGAGTVLCVQQLNDSVSAGAKFVVSPGLNEDIVIEANKLGVPVLAGTMTASEIQKAWNLGLRLVKFFPAEMAGGVAALKTFSSVFNDMSFMPTGGITPDNMADYLQLNSVLACGGTWIAPAYLLKAGKFDEISSRAKAARKAVEKIIQI